MWCWVRRRSRMRRALRCIKNLDFEPAKRGGSIMPGVERSGAPGSFEYNERAREVGGSRSSGGRPGICAIARFARSVPLTCAILGFRFAPPQALCLHPLCGFVRDSMKTAKEQALDLISRLSSDATWEDIIYCLYVRRKIEEGIKAAREGRTVPHDEVKQIFALNNE